LETDVALHSGMIVRAGHKGTVTYVDSDRIEIGPVISGGYYLLRSPGNPAATVSSLSKMHQSLTAPLQ